MSTAIQRQEQSGAITTSELGAWTREQVELVKRAICPKGITDDEFAVFIHQCQRTGMDPLVKEAFCVPRRTNVGTKDNPKWVTNHVFEPSADGMRARAARFPDFRKVDSAAVYEKDECIIDTEAGEVFHRFQPGKDRGILKGAWGRVTKADGTKVVAWLDVSDRSGNSIFWKNSQARMMEKSAEVAAIRKAYPVHLGGVYAREEMDDAPAEPTRAEVVLRAAGGEAPAKKAPALTPPPPMVRFGPHKGTALASLTPEKREETVRAGEEWLEHNPDASEKLRKNVRAAVDEVKSFRTAEPEVEDAEFTPEPKSATSITDPDAEPPEDMPLPGGAS